MQTVRFQAQFCDQQLESAGGARQGEKRPEAVAALTEAVEEEAEIEATVEARLRQVQDHSQVQNRHTSDQTRQPMHGAS